MNEKDMYELIDEPKFIRIPWCVEKTDEWYRFLGTAECRVWFRLYRNTIRKPMKSGLGQKIYNNYYKKGLVCLRCSLEEIAKDIGIKSKGRVSEYINNMVEKGILKKHMDKWNNRSIIVYEMGVHDRTVSANENMHLYTYVVEKELGKMDEKLDKFK